MIDLLRWFYTYNNCIPVLLKVLFDSLDDERIERKSTAITEGGWKPRLIEFPPGSRIGFKLSTIDGLFHDISLVVNNSGGRLSNR